mgnify:CR=1 FL=1
MIEKEKEKKDVDMLGGRNRYAKILVEQAAWNHNCNHCLADDYGVNGARGFAEGFWQILVIWLVEGVFDRFFIDWYWVNHTKAWIIEGTEDLRPYIPRKAVVKKWLFTIVVSPLMAVILSGAMLLFAR